MSFGEDSDSMINHDFGFIDEVIESCLRNLDTFKFKVYINKVVVVSIYRPDRR